MTTYKILNKKTGNCGCINCGRIQEGTRMHPYTVWHKEENEKRGHNEPVCSRECAAEYIRRKQHEERMA